MNLVIIMFYLMATIALGSALYVAASKNLVRSVFMFFITLFALAGLYVLSLADFVAITQVVVYVGGILVLILFAFMLSGRESLAGLQQQPNRLISINKLPALLLAGLFFIVLVNVFLKANVDALGWIQQAVVQHNVITPTDVTINNLGVNLMTNYLLPFEAVSILLLMALAGAAHLSRKEEAAP
ncbi:NADH-quinone oxidoreductase subunit J family protein [Mucilaginibacter terrae]|uniref:NADH-quinone oxidoreductase subunit J n=1 Tax=Mucilaginibacter terrae TaxID=1955052 RepID=A0ABU3GYJ3_9SPHI|nr:NADH-quinone oxidoreductase subunit J [Mucilaginibacter terrae]MDT3404833.1 NADH:ubiquinone oxidoreductase subunit 6 (subunit J) [Mucilaginibacter terrae]